MLIYLLKASLVWLLMLALYELLYARSKYYFANRTYLLAALFIGALLPLLPLHIWNVDYVQPAVLQPANAALPSTSTAVSEGATATAFNWQYLLWSIYATGIAVVLALMIREVIIIMRYAVYGHQRKIGSFKVFETGKQHPPFSFMGWIFIDGKDNYTDEQLNYIIRHEAAHNNRKHWLDILVMQMAVTVCWFHPLIWRIRYHLKMQHEYEADSIASGDNAYGYGHFLLQAAVQQSAPLIAHSFFYSPIKNRITMLTKNQNKSNVWRYMAIIPVLAGCLVFLSSATNNSLQRVRVGDKTTFKGNDFYWTNNSWDTAFAIDSITNEKTPVVVKKNPVIYRMNNDSVKDYNGWGFMDDGKYYQYNEQRKGFDDYVRSKFVKQFPNYSKNIGDIQIDNVVIDKDGIIQYFDINIQPNHPLKNDEEFMPQKEMDDYMEALQRIILDAPKVALTKEDLGKNIYFDFWSNVKLSVFHARMQMISK